jgi:uncharacterized protein (TIGR02996 family)
MNEAAGFLEAIRADPRDTSLRLIYADWLEEHDDPRGEFIRIQCQLADLAYRDERRASLYERQTFLLDEYGTDWLQELPQCPGIKWGWERGFPWLVHAVSVEALQREAATIFQAAPVQRLSVPIMGERDLVDLVRIPGIDRLARLDVYGSVRVAGARVLANAPELRHLEALNLNGGLIGSTGLRLLAESPFLARLTHLDLHYNEIDNAGLIDLAIASQPHRLIRLHLDSNRVTRRGLQKFLNSPDSATLRILDLSCNSVGKSGAQEIAHTRNLGDLRALYLRGNALGDDGVASLAGAPLFQLLETLDLADNDVGERGVQALLESSLASRLSSLYLEGNPISPAMQQILHDRFGPRVVL